MLMQNTHTFYGLSMWIRRYDKVFHLFKLSSIYKFSRTPFDFQSERSSLTFPLRLLSLLQQTFQIDTLWSLNWKTKRSVPDQLGKWSQSSANTKSSSVVQCLVETIVMEKNTRAGVHIRVWVLGLSMLFKDTRCNLGVLLHELEYRVICYFRA